MFADRKRNPIDMVFRIEEAGVPDRRVPPYRGFVLGRSNDRDIHAFQDNLLGTKPSLVYPKRGLHQAARVAQVVGERLQRR